MAAQEATFAYCPRHNSIPFHRFISGNEAHITDDTNIKQEDRKSVQKER